MFFLTFHCPLMGKSLIHFHSLIPFFTVKCCINCIFAIFWTIDLLKFKAMVVCVCVPYNQSTKTSLQYKNSVPIGIFHMFSCQWAMVGGSLRADVIPRFDTLQRLWGERPLDAEPRCLRDCSIKHSALTLYLLTHT